MRKGGGVKNEDERKGKFLSFLWFPVPVSDLICAIKLEDTKALAISDLSQSLNFYRMSFFARCLFLWLGMLYVQYVTDKTQNHVTKTRRRERAGSKCKGESRESEQRAR